jgi:hypothetical protein
MAKSTNGLIEIIPLRVLGLNELNFQVRFHFFNSFSREMAEIGSS